MCKSGEGVGFFRIERAGKLTAAGKRYRFANLFAELIYLISSYGTRIIIFCFLQNFFYLCKDIVLFVRYACA